MRFTSPTLSSRAVRPLGMLAAAVVLSIALHTMPVRADDTAPPVNVTASVPTAASGSASGLPIGAFYDPTRMSFHQSVEIGASTGGLYRGTAGLYTASFGYKLANPLQMHLDLGAAYTPSANISPYGAASYNPGFSGLFVKNLSLDWRPGANSLVRFSYQNVRSPLQYNGFGSPYGSYYDPWYNPAVEQPSRN